MSRPFLETLRELRQGRTIEELADHLTELVAAVKSTGKPGELVLKIRVKPGNKGGAHYLVVEDDVLLKLPKAQRQDTVFFPTADNTLSRNDPGQLQLGLKPIESVDMSTGEIRNAS